MLQANPDNQYPDCIYFNLRGQSNPWAQNQVDLYLTINFNEQWQDLIGGRIRVGLKGGELRLIIVNGTMPYESRQLTGLLALSVPKKRTLRAAEKRTTAFELGMGKMPSGSKPGIRATAGLEQTQTRADEFRFIACQITTKGSEESPAWEFAVETGAPVLKGLLKNAFLGTMHLQAKPCSVEAVFRISKRDLYLTDAEGLWPSDISQNKRAILERMIVLRLLASKYQPYLSRMELYYE